MKNPALCLLFCFLTSLLLPAAQAATGERIAKIDVVGNERIDRGFIMNNIKSKENDEYDPEKIREDLKSIYRTGFFTDIQIDVKDSEKGKIVTFIVIERPPIAGIYISGNKKVRTDDIRGKIKVKTNSVLNTDRIRESVDEIKKLYASRGYYATRITYEVDYEEGDKVNVRFVIDEAQKAAVRKIVFTGNEHFKSSKLKGVMRVKEKGIFSWFTGSGILEEETLDEDRKMLEAFYADNGYVRAKTGIPDIQLSKNLKSITITIPIQEGQEYKVGKVGFAGDILFDEAAMVKTLKTKEGNLFRASLFQQDALSLSDVYQDKGYAFVDVNPLTVINDDDRVVDITYDIAKGSEVYFNRISIVGNVKTRDKVVRRELRVIEGDRYSASKMKESKRRLTNTTYFKTTDLKIVKTDEPDKVNLETEVEEKPTGSLSLGIGYSTFEKIMVTGSVSQENILGTGRKVFLQAGVSAITTDFSLTMVEPYIFDKNLTLATTLFNVDKAFDAYDYRGTGGNVSLLRPLTDYLTAGLKYRYENVTVSNVEPFAGIFVREQRGTRSTSSVTASIGKNSIDDVLNPTRGVTSLASVEVAGGPFMGDNQFVKTVLTYGRYFPWKGETTFFLRGTAGAAKGYGGEEVPIYERFFVGGIDTVRGFEYGRAGPVDTESDDAIGGKNELYFNNEFIFPIVKQVGLKGVVFVDVGHGFNDTQGFLFSDMRVGLGTGLRWNSPIGPIRLELGFNPAQRKGEKRTVFEFAIGRTF